MKHWAITQSSTGLQRTGISQPLIDNLKPQRWIPRGLFMSQSKQLSELINMSIAEGLAVLAPHLQDWLRAHLVPPRPIQVSVDLEGNSFKDLWLITDHTGKQDSSYRIVYDENNQMFGLESTLDTGIEWYMGSYGSFSETVENM
jgi:hypothetical protein